MRGPRDVTQYLEDMLEAAEKALFGRTVDLEAVRNPFVLGSILMSRVPLYAAA